jgi:anaerobic ribonucleoside-triphosphate reductase activating protein
MNVKYGGNIFMSYTNGKGCRSVFFLAGCPHHCRNCQNEHLWDIESGADVDITMLYKIIDKASVAVDGITISGGDPFVQPEVTLALTKYAKDKNLNVWIYTGYLYEDLIKMSKDNTVIGDILKTADILVDGKFVQELYDPQLEYRGSSNQRIINLKEK